MQKDLKQRQPAFSVSEDLNVFLLVDSVGKTHR